MTRELGQSLSAYRNRLAKNARHWGRWARRQGLSCYRIFDRELPEFPLLIDYYEGHLHLQELNTGWTQTPEEHDAWFAAVRAATAAALAIDSACVHGKVRARQAHRMAGGQYERVADGEDFVVHEAGLKFWVNLDAYVDTGLFLDHRLTRALVRERAKDKRFLNLFGYTGSFTVYVAAGGAVATETIDLSNTYLNWARRNLQLNGLDIGRHSLVRADAFTWLRQAVLERKRFDLIMLDPPSFSHSKKMAGVLDVQRDHLWLVRQAAGLLAPGGELLFSTNLRNFVLDPSLNNDFECNDITGRTVPEDFRRRTPHRCWRIQAT